MARIRQGLVCGLAALGAYVGVVRPWHLRWGTTPREFAAALPGDDFIPDPDLVATRAIAVGAPATAVWPWIAQLGQSRGGFYSYERLENLFGCDIRNADRIVPEWQHVRAGDEVKLHPDVALEVVAVQPGRALVLRGAVAPGDEPPPYDFTWAFVVNPQPDGTIRLVVRERYAYGSRWAALLVEPVQIVSFVMSQKMLRGIRDRAEQFEVGASIDQAGAAAASSPAKSR